MQASGWSCRSLGSLLDLMLLVQGVYGSCWAVATPVSARLGTLCTHVQPKCTQTNKAVHCHQWQTEWWWCVSLQLIMSPGIPWGVSLTQQSSCNSIPRSKITTFLEHQTSYKEHICLVNLLHTKSCCHCFTVCLILGSWATAAQIVHLKFEWSICSCSILQLPAATTG